MWTALSAWGNLELQSRFTDGIVSEVYLASLNGSKVVVRKGQRTVEYLEWECALLDFLDKAGLPVPKLIPSIDGKPHVDGVVVMELVEGIPPSSLEDWKEASDYLRRLHELASTWPQRPGALAAVNVGEPVAASNVDLSVLPEWAFRICREAWNALPDIPSVVVHGDPNPRNIRMTANGPVLLDWDEARVDHPYFDLGGPQDDRGGLTPDEWSVARPAYIAWDAAVCWSLDRNYASERFQTLVDGSWNAPVNLS